MNKSQSLKEIVNANEERRSANLCGADLRYADLSYTDLSYAVLRGASLRYTDLSYTNLSCADLSYTNLDSVNLKCANLRGALLPAPTVMLLARWGRLSDSLTLEGMRYDAYNHPDPYTFDAWAKGGPCPYNESCIHRAFNFEERRGLWTPWNPRDRVLSAYELMKRVITEKCSDSDFHKGE